MSKAAYFGVPWSEGGRPGDEIAGEVRASPLTDSTEANPRRETNSSSSCRLRRSSLQWGHAWKRSSERIGQCQRGRCAIAPANDGAGRRTVTELAEAGIGLQFPVRCQGVFGADTGFDLATPRLRRVHRE